MLAAHHAAHDGPHHGPDRDGEPVDQFTQVFLAGLRAALRLDGGKPHECASRGAAQEPQADAFAAVTPAGARAGAQVESCAGYAWDVDDRPVLVTQHDV